MKTAVARDSKLANTPGYIQAMSGPLGQLMIGSLAAGVYTFATGGN